MARALSIAQNARVEGEVVVEEVNETSRRILPSLGSLTQPGLRGLPSSMLP